MQTQDHRPLLERFKASRPFVMNIGRCAIVAGDDRPFMITEWTGPEYELLCLSGDDIDLIYRPVSEVTVVPNVRVRRDEAGRIAGVMS